MKRGIYIYTICIIIILSFVFIHWEYTKNEVRSKIINSQVDNTPGNAPENTYPLILLHGFNPSYSTKISQYLMKELAGKLAHDLEYNDKGIITPSTSCAELKYSEKPILLRLSYLKDNNLIEIPEYSENLAESIHFILNCTGAKKVDVIAHSMGGIVTRYYSHNNPTSIRKLIMLGTPNRGGLYGVGEVANQLTDTKLEFDFISLSEDHIFMNELNKKENVKDIQYYTIAGNVDGKGDGMILESSVPLKESIHHIVHCRHNFLKQPFACPEAYKLIKEAILD